VSQSVLPDHDRFVINISDDVRGTQSGQLRRAPTLNAREYDAETVFQSERTGLVRCQRFRPHAEPAANDPAVHDEVIHDAANQVYGNSETDPFRVQSTRKKRRVDADQLPRRVDQRSTRIAEVDRGIRLDKILERRQAQLSPPGTADYPLGDGLSDAEGIADGENNVSYLQSIGSPDRDLRKSLEPDSEQGEICIRISADDVCSGR
jgi:hypothetical protein